MKSDEITQFRAEFVSLESKEDETFKYRYRHLIQIVKVKSLNIKRFINILVSKLTILLKTVNWKLTLHDTLFWIIEIFIEGLTANFALHTLFDVKFNVWTVFAYGILIKQGLSIVGEIIGKITNGPNNKIPPTSSARDEFSFAST
jgi:hypothetical protein